MSTAYTSEELKGKFKELFQEEGSVIRDISPFSTKQYSGKSALYFEPSYSDLSLELELDVLDYVRKHPEEGLRAMKDALEEVGYTGIFQVSGEESLEVGIKDLPETHIKEVRELREEHIGEYVGLRGIVSRTSESFPKPVMIPYECESCGNRTMEPQERDSYERKQPLGCSSCGKSSNKTSFVPIKRDIEWEDIQEARISERHRDLKAGERPRDKKAIFSNQLVDQVKPSDEVILYGIYRAKFKGKSSKPETYFEVKSFEVVSKEFSEVELEEEEEKKVEELACDPKIFKKIVESINPSIHGMEEIKKSIALQLFGGVRKGNENTHYRGDIHILLAGDPETGKSQLLDYVSKIAPKGILGSGRGTSGAGLTAAVKKDEVAGENRWVVEPGILPLADGGLAAIDEFDKMRSEDRDTMHRAIEQQDVSIDKAGIHRTLNSRCPVLAAANPQTGRFSKSDLNNPEKKLIEELDLRPELRNRFDYIWIITGDRDEEEERKLSKHVADLHQELGRGGTGEDKFKPPISQKELKNYIKKAKEIDPVITDEVKEELREFYHHIIDKLDLGSSPRLENSLFRSAEASARLHFRDEVTLEDSKIAIELKEEQLKSAKELELLYTGFTDRERTVFKEVRNLIDALESEYERGIPEQHILAAAEDDGLDPKEVGDQLSRMVRKGRLKERNGRYEFA